VPSVTEGYDLGVALRVAVCVIAMAVGFAVLVAVRFRWNVGARSVRNFMIYFGVAFALIVGVAASSKDYEVRCRDDPNEWCIYNDGVPAISTITFVYFASALYRSWNLYDHR